MKNKSSFIILLLAFSLCLSSCSYDKYQVKKTYEKFNASLNKNKGNAVYELTDAESHLYFKQLLQKTRSLDSVQLFSQSVINKMNIMMARGLLSDSLLFTASTKEFTTALYDTKEFDLLSKMTGNRQFEISWMAIKNGQAEITLENDKIIYLNKEDGNWKVNLPSLMRHSNALLNESTRIARSNGIKKNEVIQTYIKNRISNSLVKPFNYVYWPIGVKENEDFFNNNFHFSTDLSCANQSNLTKKTNAKVLVFTGYDNIATKFHNKFIESNAFKTFAGNNFDFILLTQNCKLGKKMFDEYDIHNIPTILFIDDKGTVLKKSIGYYIAPEMYIEQLLSDDSLKAILTQ